jgi:Tol biopolymer transport system component
MDVSRASSGIRWNRAIFTSLAATTLAVLLVGSGPPVEAATSARTSLVSRSSGGVQGDAESYLPSVTADGRYIAFESGSTNLVGNDTNNATDIFVRDRVTGKTVRVSLSSGGAQGNDGSYNANISADGRYVAFISDATNLVPHDTNAATDVFVRDRVNHVTKRISVNTAGRQANATSYSPVVSADGRFVAFWSVASNLVHHDTNAAPDVFVRDRQRKTTTRVSINTAGFEGNGGSRNPTISRDGRFVAFESLANNLIGSDTNAVADIFVRDRLRKVTLRASIGSAGAQGDGASTTPSISADGRYLAFRSAATNLVGDDPNGYDDIFVRDRRNKTTRLVSVSSAGVHANFHCLEPAISATGRFVTFFSGASNLVGSDTNLQSDIFMRDRGTGTTKRVSVSSAGDEANNASNGPAPVSDDGRIVAFYSTASNLIGSDTNNNDDVFIRIWSP